MVPQAPFIFQGSVRQNLDPYQAHTDSEVMEALKQVQLWEALSRLQASSGGRSSNESSQGGITQHSCQDSSSAACSTTTASFNDDIVVDVASSDTLGTAGSQHSSSVLGMQLGEGSLGLSLGQQQLLCLARVLLKRPRLLCLDECTASVDPATAATMHKVGEWPFTREFQACRVTCAAFICPAEDAWGQQPSTPGVVAYSIHTCSAAMPVSLHFPARWPARYAISHHARSCLPMFVEVVIVGL